MALVGFKGKGDQGDCLVKELNICLFTKSPAISNHVLAGAHAVVPETADRDQGPARARQLEQLEADHARTSCPRSAPRRRYSVVAVQAKDVLPGGTLDAQQRVPA